MSSPTTRIPPTENMRCSSCESKRPLDWFKSKVSRSHGLLDTTTKTCKQCRVCFPATASSLPGAHTMLRTSKPHPENANVKPKLQQSLINPVACLSISSQPRIPTPNLSGRSGTSISTSTASVHNIEFQKMQHSFEAIKLLDQDEVNAAANLLLDQIDEPGDSDDGQDAMCDDEGRDRGRED
ncbi:hypothetical protein M436DRAFT_68180 [Aureobasidium namibiae CBS 147.97]|uniref:Stc1 domain-containing protein n=1 Tax=Aureobasidium namibiae CBS 147.97 TaxID=1043004 RepID=A0A074WA00_9PEZI